MKVSFSNAVSAVAVFLTLSAGLKAQETQVPSSEPPASAQPQSQPAAPDSTSPQQEPVRDQSPTPAPDATSSQSEPTQKPDGESQAQPQATPSTQNLPSATAKPHTTAKPKSNRKKRTASSKTQPTTQGGKVVVRNGGARESTTQISPGVNDQQAQNQRNVTSQLLATTDANLKNVSSKQLTPAQQSMLDQVNSYVRQSKAASDAGDIPRAHTLAVKAQLLSNELARK